MSVQQFPRCRGPLSPAYPGISSPEMGGPVGLEGDDRRFNILYSETTSIIEDVSSLNMTLIFQFG